MAITNPQAIKFVNEQVRPLAEELRAVMARLTSAQTDWFGGINALFPNDSTAVADNRDAEGVSRLTGQDINSLMSTAIAVLGASNTTIIAKPCVRPLTAN